MEGLNLKKLKKGMRTSLVFLLFYPCAKLTMMRTCYSFQSLNIFAINYVAYR